MCGTQFILIFVEKITILVQIWPKFGLSGVFFHPLKNFNVLESDQIVFTGCKITIAPPSTA